MGLLPLELVKNVDPRFLLQFELIGIPRLARTNQLLPFRGTSNVLDVRSIAVGEAKDFHHVLHAATWTFHVKAGSRHRVPDSHQRNRVPGACQLSLAVRARSGSAAYPAAEVPMTAS